MHMYMLILLMIAHYQVVLTSSTIYHIAQNFDGGNFDIFDAFQLDRQNLTCQIF